MQRLIILARHLWKCTPVVTTARLILMLKRSVAAEIEHAHCRRAVALIQILIPVQTMITTDLFLQFWV